jgi:hypothetical protein
MEGMCQYTMKVEPGKQYLLVPRTNGFGMHARAEIEDDIEFDIVDAQGLLRAIAEKALRVLY